MIGEWIRFGVTALCVVGGLFALLTALLGLFRFDYALNRLHAAAIADTLALRLVLLGVMVAVGFRAVLWKLVLVLVISGIPPCPAICWRNSVPGRAGGSGPLSGAAGGNGGGERPMSTVFRLLLLAGLLVCAVATALVKKPLRAVIIYMAYSIIMSVIWILLEAPDLALTEAAVGAGITGILFFLTLRRIDRIDRDADVEETQGEEEPHEENEAAH